MPKKQPIPFGKYLLLDRVNIGGMAEVWKAKTFGAEGFEKLVAIKRILPNIAEDEEFIAMFIDEAKISVQLTHANIAQVFDLGKIGDSYYIAMEYVSGKDLRAMFDKARKRGEPAPIALTCYCLSKAAEGLDYAHRKRDAHGVELNIVHRDVSPQNILCSYDGETKVIDFGIAKAANKATKTQAGILKGKFGYMSPEQVRGLPLDRRSDVFALGVVLYEMLTGERLFVGESDFSVLEKVRAVDILPPSTYNRRIPAELEKIVLRALAKDVEDRFSYASELGDALQRFLITSDTIFSRKDLMQFMKSTFAEDVEREKTRLAEYAQIKLPPGMSALSGAPVLAPRPSAPAAPVLAPRPPAPAAPVLAPPPRLAPPMLEPEPEPDDESTAEATMMAPPPTADDPQVRPPAAPRAPTPRPPASPADGLRPPPPGVRAAVPGPPVIARTASNGGALPARAPSLPPQPPLAPVLAAPSSLPEMFDDVDVDLTEAPVPVARTKSVERPAAPPPPSQREGRLPLILGGVVAVILTCAVGAYFAVGRPTGALLLNCTPSEGLVILIDGQSVGTSTPLMRAKLAAGAHMLSITARGYDILRKPFTISGHQTQAEELILQKKGGAASPTVAAAGAKVPVAIAVSTAGAEVSLDGRVVIAADAKQTVFTSQIEGSAQHVVEAKLAGYQTFSQTYAPGQPIQLQVALQKK